MKTTRLSRLLWALVLAVAALVLAAPSVALADTTYTVRVFGGNNGTVNGKPMDQKTFTYVDGEDAPRVTLSSNPDDNADFYAVQNNDKYYVKGFRISGEDNSDGLYASYPVDHDVDFVVAYGVRGKMVTYTVRFVENGTGNPLTDDQGRTSVTYEGKVGDRPVVAYSYVPGYRPLYRNITGTLREDSDNVWDLPYTRIETETTVTDQGVTSTTTTTTPGTTTVTTTGGTTTGGTTTGGTTAGGTEGTNAEGTNTEGGTEGEATTIETTGNEGTTETQTNVEPAPPATEEILDVDNPLAAPTTDDGGDSDNNATTNGGSTTPEKSSSFSPALIVGIIAAIAALIAVFLLLRSRNSDDEDEDLEE